MTINEGSGKETSLRKNVNIYNYPNNDVVNTHPQGSVITLGDLHGNAAKFLHMLVREGALELSEDNYNKLIGIYKNSNQDYNVDEFVNILKEVKLKNPCPKLRLIGDDLADRGNNDLLTLLIFERLRQLDMSVDIIASNHGVEFLKQYAYGINAPLQILYKDDYHTFGASLHGLRNDITRGKVNSDRVDAIIQESYLPNMKLLSYLITDDNKISIYSHAPINETKISLLATLMGVDHRGETVQDLAKTIDAINHAFRDIVKDKNKLHAFFEELKTNNDKFKILDDFINDRYQQLREDHTPRIYETINIHGHVGEETSERVGNWSYCNLDSDLGKNESFTNHEYLVYLSKESDYTPKLQSTRQVNPISTHSSTAQMDKILDIPIPQNNLTSESAQQRKIKPMPPPKPKRPAQASIDAGKYTAISTPATVALSTPATVEEFQDLKQLQQFLSTPANKLALSEAAKKDGIHHSTSFIFEYTHLQNMIKNNELSPMAKRGYLDNMYTKFIQNNNELSDDTKAKAKQMHDMDREYDKNNEKNLNEYFKTLSIAANEIGSKLNNTYQLNADTTQLSHPLFYNISTIDNIRKNIVLIKDHYENKDNRSKKDTLFAGRANRALIELDNSGDINNALSILSGNKDSIKNKIVGMIYSVRISETLVSNTFYLNQLSLIELTHKNFEDHNKPAAKKSIAPSIEKERDDRFSSR